MLFTAAKITQLAMLPQGKVEAKKRVCVMTEEMLKQGFGNCSNHYECQAACPKGIKVSFIAKLNREFMKSFRFTAESNTGSQTNDV
jgi:succinate dehydrogenase / fumarate reductase iron-sulfur subunit